LATPDHVSQDGWIRSCACSTALALRSSLITRRARLLAPEARAASSKILARLSHVLNRERPAGVEPAQPPWQVEPKPYRDS